MILPRSSEGLYLLQRIRDEAHRFAITHHRSRRSKTMVESLLDDVPGLGEVRRKTLLKHFGSLKKLRAADGRRDREVPGHRPPHRRRRSRMRSRSRGDRRKTGLREHQRQHGDDRRDRGALTDSERRRHRGELVVVTGMTGAGRSTAAKELEDLGFYVVDNLPPELLRDVVRLVDESERRRAADRGRGRRPLRVVLRVPARQPRPGRDRPAHDAAVPRGHRRRAGTPPGGRPPAAPAAGRAAGCSTGSSASARCSADLRGDADLVIDTSNAQRPPAHRHGSPRRSATPDADPAADHRGQLRLQVRHPGRRRLRRRHAVPAQPVLDARAAARDRPRRRRRRLRQGPAGRQAVPGPATCPCSRASPTGYLARGQAVHDRRDRLHRRQAPQRGDDRGDRPPAARRRATTARPSTATWGGSDVS